MRAWVCFAALGAALAGCSGGGHDDAGPQDAGLDAGGDAAGDGGVQLPSDRGFATLSEYGLFVGNGASQQPAPGVIPYEVNSPLYADFASKGRFLYVPPGAHVTFVDADRWAFPVGSILVKTFYYPRDARDPSQGERLIETRLLLHQEMGWRAETYVWNDAQTEANRMPAGDNIPVTWIDATGATRSTSYYLPNTVECGRCHGNPDPTRPNPMNVLGLRTGQLNRDHDYGTGTPENQITHLAALGLFDRTPAAPATLERFEEPFGTGPVEARARSYLHANCAHCHNPTSPSGFSGLQLNIEMTDPTALGVCKIPSSAGDTGGLQFDVVPGDPDHSVLPYRMNLTMSTSMMPPLGRTLADAQGVDLIRQWITGLPPGPCSH